MSSNPFTQLEALVQDAEVYRNAQQTSAVQHYVDTHPELPDYTRNLTHEIQDKILFYIANGDRARKPRFARKSTSSVPRLMPCMSQETCFSLYSVKRSS